MVGTERFLDFRGDRLAKTHSIYKKRKHLYQEKKNGKIKDPPWPPRRCDLCHLICGSQI